MITTQPIQHDLHLQRGQRLRCQTCDFEIEVVETCDCDDGQPAFTCCGHPLISTGRTMIAETKEAFVARIQEGMQQTKDAIGFLREKANDAQDSAKDEISSLADSLSERHETLNESLSKVKSSTGEAWKDLASGCSDAWEEFWKAYSQAVGRYK